MTNNKSTYQYFMDMANVHPDRNSEVFQRNIRDYTKYHIQQGLFTSTESDEENEYRAGQLFMEFEEITEGLKSGDRSPSGQMAMALNKLDGRRPLEWNWPVGETPPPGQR